MNNTSIEQQPLFSLPFLANNNPQCTTTVWYKEQPQNDVLSIILADATKCAAYLFIAVSYQLSKE